MEDAPPQGFALTDRTMRLYTLCNCGKRIYLKGRFATAEDLRNQKGEIIPYKCPRCGRRGHHPYTYVWTRTWGPWVTVALLSAFVLGGTAIVALLQLLYVDIITVVWIPIAALTLFALLAKRESDAVELFKQSLEKASHPRLTAETASDFSELDLVEWFDVGEPNDITNEYTQVVYYASVLNHLEAPRYFEWFYYYEANEHNTPDDGTLLYNSLVAIGATSHAAIVQEAREVYLRHRDEIDQCVQSETDDGYQKLLALNLFNKQDNATHEAFYSEPLVPLLAQYIRNNLDNLQS